MIAHRSLVTFVSFLLFAAFCVDAKPLRKRTARTTAPAGALVVSTNPTNGQFSSLQDAVNALPSDGSTQTIFIEAGTYEGQVYINSTGMLTIMGETEDTSTYASNVVTLTFSASLGTAGSDDLSGTLRVHKDDFALYNVNVMNTFGEAAVNGQAIAISAYGTNHGYYASGFYSYQDTVLAEQGNQYYGFCFIQGAVDFIFGQHAFAFFQSNTIASVGPGAITADVPLTIHILAGSVAFTSCSLSSIINPAGWEIWSTTEPNTEDVTFAEFDNTDSGASGTRVSFSTKLTSTAGYTIADVLGSDWTSWVDQDYV
ncbi:pectin lyase fold/virulence factor [Rhodocollybia butyracea]|uniref:Pectinesterase n=1 Tax=Rhodocollybia butyracea TaxID=206335 RepID=A0A9P5P4U3_9AGAR|nr:pectin lyase fold/virulence factor [Rhodocollybia butyracea]